MARACTPVMVKIDWDLGTEGEEVDHILRQCMRQHLTAPQRALDLFMEMYERLSKTGLATDGAFKLPLRYTDVSELLAITPIHFSRVLKQLKAGGRISVDGGMVRLLRRAARTADISRSTVAVTA